MSTARSSSSRRREGAKAPTTRDPRVLDTLPLDDGLVVATTEWEFVWRWWAHASHGNPVAAELLQYVPPEALWKDRFLREVYDYLGQQHAKGASVTDTTVTAHLLHIAKALGKHDEWARLERFALMQDPEDPEELRQHARSVIGLHRTRSQLDMLEGAALLTRQVLEGKEPGGYLEARRYAEDLMQRLLTLHSKHAERGGPVTQEEIVTHLLQRVDPTRTPGIAWPWPMMNDLLGEIMPGDLIGLTAYSGNGKTLLIANLFLCWALADIPVIVFPTEMELRFLERVVAAFARVPKRFAEKGDWRTATPAQMRRYREAMRQLIGLPWDVVQQSSISPEEVVARVQVLRRKWRGRHVLVVVDHLHRLRYPPGVKPDDALGVADASQKLKNMALDDRDGGLSVLALYQPKQPEDEAKRYRPVPMFGIRGHSGAPTELDVHFSCFRRVVRTTSARRTPWGTERALYEHETDAHPAAGEFGKPGTKLDDEHFYASKDKDRVNGVQGSHMDTIGLHIHSPSGFIYEDDWLRGIEEDDTPPSQGEQQP